MIAFLRMQSWLRGEAIQTMALCAPEHLWEKVMLRSMKMSEAVDLLACHVCDHATALSKRV